VTDAAGNTATDQITITINDTSAGEDSTGDDESSGGALD